MFRFFQALKNLTELETCASTGVSMIENESERKEARANRSHKLTHLFRLPKKARTKFVNDTQKKMEKSEIKKDEKPTNKKT